MAPEYIERGAAKRWLVNGYAYAAAKMLDDIPTADVAPVVHGSWKLNDDGSATCGHCGRTTKYAWDDDSVLKYCPDCGAKMR